VVPSVMSCWVTTVEIHIRYAVIAKTAPNINTRQRLFHFLRSLRSHVLIVTQPKNLPRRVCRKRTEISEILIINYSLKLTSSENEVACLN
jgi:hypothetical protein